MVSVFGCSGCATTEHVMSKTSKHYETDKQGNQAMVDGNPAYILLVPLTIPYDIVAAPVRGIIWVKAMKGAGDGSGSH